MISPRLRCAVITAAGAAVLLANLSCDALNPTFVNELGGNAIRSTPSPTGSIVIVFNNQRLLRLTMTYDLEMTVPGLAPQQITGATLSTDTGYWTATLDCYTTSIKITSITAAGTSASQPSTQPSVAGLTLATNTFAPPALQCGSVLFVIVPLLGSPTAELVP
jgi:hypothetical protein